MLKDSALQKCCSPLCKDVPKPHCLCSHRAAPSPCCAACTQQRCSSFLTCPTAEPLIIFICIRRNIFGATSIASPFKNHQEGSRCCEGGSSHHCNLGDFI